MKENRVKAMWRSDKPVINGWLGIPSPVAAENMARCGWDSLVIDLQHGLVDYQAAVGMLQAISQTDTVPMARVAWNTTEPVTKLLDAGALGIICPMINTRAECEFFIRNCRYPPRGNRSYGPLRATWHAGAEYWERSDELVITMAMIETIEAVRNMDDILSVPGLDSIYVGPADLASSMGHRPGPDQKVPEVYAAITAIAEAAKRHGIFAGIHCYDEDYARDMIRKGYRFITMADDNALLSQAARQTIANMRGQSAPVVMDAL